MIKRAALLFFLLGLNSCGSLAPGMAASIPDDTGECAPIQDVLHAVHAVLPIKEGIEIKDPAMLARLFEWLNKGDKPVPEGTTRAAILFHENSLGVVLGHDNVICYTGLVAAGKENEFVDYVVGIRPKGPSI